MRIKHKWATDELHRDMRISDLKRKGYRIVSCELVCLPKQNKNWWSIYYR